MNRRRDARRVVSVIGCSTRRQAIWAKSNTIAAAFAGFIQNLQRSEVNPGSLRSYNRTPIARSQFYSLSDLFLLRHVPEHLREHGFFWMLDAGVRIGKGFPPECVKKGCTHERQRYFHAWLKPIRAESPGRSTHLEVCAKLRMGLARTVAGHPTSNRIAGRITGSNRSMPSVALYSLPA